MSDKKECVKVAVRCRPMNTDQIERKDQQIVHVHQQRGEIVVNTVKDIAQKQRMFSFDMVFAQNCLQSAVFQQAALPIIQSVLEGYNGTIFAYGQTGTGKTHTMQGSKTQENERGVIPRTFEHIIKSIEGIPDANFMVQVSMLQLYNEEIVDLLSIDNKTSKLTKLQLHQNKDKGVYVHGLTYYPVTKVQEMKKKLKQGSKSRHTGSTQMNMHSSRSHSIFVIRVQQEIMVEGQSKIKAGRLNLVDLAGSQRQKKTQSTGDRSKQGIHINLALSTLGQVIGALTNPNQTHIPYRDSKLTRLLQQSLGGNAKTIMIANIGPSSHNSDETVCTLRYAAQAKRIKNKPKVNEDPKDAMIRQYQEQIERLKRQLQGKLPLGGNVVQKKVKVARKVDLNTRLQHERQNIEKQKKQLLKQQQRQKQQLQSKKLSVEQQRQEQKKKQQQLALKLKQMKEKFLHGSKLKEQARLHDKKIFQSQLELQERKQKQRRLAEQLEQRNLQVQDINEKNLPLKEKVEQQKKQINKINHKVKIVNQQTVDIEQSMMQQTLELEQENRQLLTEIKLTDLIIQNFIPISEVQNIQPRLNFDERYDDWMIKPKEKMIPNPGSSLGLRSPLFAEGRAAVAYGDDNPRFRQQNIIMMSPSMVDQTTEDFSDQNISPNVLENLRVVLNDNQEQQRQIAQEQRPNVYIDDPNKMDKEQILKKHEVNNRAKSAKMMRPSSGRRKKNV